MTRTVRAYAPGRSELAGNHTDHQGGRAIAAALDCGIEVTARANGSGRISLESEGFAPVCIDASQPGPRGAERGTTAALLRGVVDCLAEAGLHVGGFDAHAKSTVPPGGGLSSSAAFELALICAVQQLFGGEGAPLQTPADRAQVAVRVERDYFGKPCGLLDQTAIAYGGVTCIDFSRTVGVAPPRKDRIGAAASPAENVPQPAVERLEVDFEAAGIALCLVDAHCDHSRYTREYAQVALDMFAVARFLGAHALSQVPEGAFLERFADVRCELGDLPALRALHYYHEMSLVDERACALRAGDMRTFLDATRRSGASSAQYLQNVSTSDRAFQPAMIALALADRFAGAQGACRIHGGGFGGTVQAFVPSDALDGFVRAIDARLGAGSCKAYRITARGACSG